MKKTKLEKIAKAPEVTNPHGIIKLLLADHKLLRKLMSQVKSSKATDAQKVKAFMALKKNVASHVKAEETTFLTLIRDNPRFEDQVLEGYEEHRVHETVLAGIGKVSVKERRIEQMKIFCEILEHHLDEEEEDLFPRFKKYAASKTRKKIGKKYLKVRKKSASEKRGAARFSEN